MSIIKTKIEIIDETAEFYSKNPRSNIGGSCKYLSDNGAKCAFSRCCTDEGVKTLHETLEGKSVTSQQFGPTDFYLKDEYKGHDVKFWRALQGFHDDEKNFITEGIGLSARGIERVADMKEIFK